MNQLVSVLTPFYNSEAYLPEYLETIQSQTYRPIELICVNDGSTDKTEQILLSKTEEFRQDNIEIKYIFKENGGIGSAISAGLKNFTGTYLAWIDHDDLILPAFIEKSVRFLEDNPQYGFCVSDITVYNENMPEIAEKKLGFKEKKEYVFKDILKGNFRFCPLGYLVRSNEMIKAIPDRTIYHSRYGQNIQMFLPLSHQNKLGYIDEVLGRRIIRKTSCSYADVKSGTEKQVSKQLEILDTYVETLRKMPKEVHHYVFYFEALKLINPLAFKLSKKEYDPGGAKAAVAVAGRSFILLLKSCKLLLLSSFAAVRTSMSGDKHE